DRDGGALHKRKKVVPKGAELGVIDPFANPHSPAPLRRFGMEQLGRRNPMLPNSFISFRGREVQPNGHHFPVTIRLLLLCRGHRGETIERNTSKPRWTIAKSSFGKKLRTRRFGLKQTLHRSVEY